MASTSSLHGGASRLLSTTFALAARRPQQQPTTTTTTLTAVITTTTTVATQRSQLHTSAPLQKGQPSKNAKGGGSKGANYFLQGKSMTKGAKKAQSAKEKEEDAKLSVFRKAVLSVRRTPPPLRMGRNRHLRHWTIHRAWQLLMRQQREGQDRMLMRQYQSMHNACEELRKTSGPGPEAEGYLYRVAMEKKGVWHGEGFPIEYARLQTETPAREAWNHDWKR